LGSQLQQIEVQGLACKRHRNASIQLHFKQGLDCKITRIQRTKLKAAFGIGKRSRFGKRLFVVFFLGNDSNIKGRDVSPLNAAPHGHYCRPLPASIDLWLYKSRVKATSQKKKGGGRAGEARGRSRAEREENRAKIEQKKSKYTEKRRKERERSNTETSIGSAIAFVPADKERPRISQNKFTESRYIHHLLSSFII